jgi:hypothetical protein
MKSALSPVALGLAAAGLVLGWFASGGSVLWALVFAIIGFAVGAGVRALLAASAARTGPGARIDPFTLGEPWRRAVQDAVQARNRFRAAAGQARSGPFRERLQELSADIDRGADECWRIAQQGQALSDARRRIERRAAEGKLQALTAEGEPATDTPAAATAEALRAQLDTADRLDHTIDDTRERLGLLGARLDEAAARAAELLVHAPTADALSALDSEISDVVTDMEALRQALEEVEGRPRLPELPGSPEPSEGAEPEERAEPTRSPESPGSPQPDAG